MTDSSSPSVPLLEGGTVAGVAFAATTVELLLPVTVIAVDAELDWCLDTECCATTGAVTVVELVTGAVVDLSACLWQRGCSCSAT